ncbi:hypothetical protein B0H10DRAFT_1178917 [Mycena sp. CBHHK59/15]|nr:hypothetical protein B0H10DRAFT_1178917 [Mycena sp. CBHHK59/15]
MLLTKNSAPHPTPASFSATSRSSSITSIAKSSRATLKHPRSSPTTALSTTLPTVTSRRCVPKWRFSGPRLSNSSSATALLHCFCGRPRSRWLSPSANSPKISRPRPSSNTTTPRQQSSGEPSSSG